MKRVILIDSQERFHLVFTRSEQEPTNYTLIGALMYAIPVDHSGLAPLFDQPYLYHVLRGMQAGNSPALAWADDQDTRLFH